MKKLVLRNITKYDIMISDLRFKVPAGRSIDIFNKNNRLLPQDIINSYNSGSIKKLLGRYLTEEVEVKELPKIPILVSKNEKIVFPQRARQNIIIEVSDLAKEDEINKLSLDEDDELLKELSLDNGIQEDLPVSIKKEE